MNRQRLVKIALILAVVFIIAILILPSFGVDIGPLSGKTSSVQRSNEDVGESSPPEQTEVEKMESFIKKNGWAAKLPYLNDHFSIYLDSFGAKIELSVVLESKNASEFSSYKQEAENWMRQNAIPTGEASITYTYRGQE